MFRIIHSNNTYYKGMTAIGPCFGAAKEDAATFDTLEDAIIEMQQHPIGFCEATVTTQ